MAPLVWAALYRLIVQREGPRVRLFTRRGLMSLYFSGNFLVEVAVPRLELPGPNAVTVIL